LLATLGFVGEARWDSPRVKNKSLAGVKSRLKEAQNLNA
jgi:hypothetical protein